ncbi:BTB domain-containing protein [Favolaschia claudopus]|uniref:BTB domain-containing protein n=1 Tax=Favolaschia claudopus TaxID=2862362 RepID=A0AAW0BGB9_9AGAR
MSSAEFESPSAKRQRIDDAEIIRSDIWKSDGSVILQAENIQFRVHWSVLAQNSSVFSDMAGLPQPSDEPTIEGCAIVELTDDAVDVEFLLKALYIPTFHSQILLPLAAVGAIIRLSRKYDIKDLFDSAVARLTSEFPTTLDEYDTISKDPTRFKRIEQYDGLLFDMIALASKNYILTPLPCAYYTLVRRYSIAALFRGVQHDGTLSSISGVDLSRCAAAHEKLLVKQLQPGYTLGWTRKWDFEGQCTSSRCQGIRSFALAHHLDNSWIDALASPTALDRMGYCPSCTRHVNEAVTAGRRRIWNELPSFFDLPPWGQLRNGD